MNMSRDTPTDSAACGTDRGYGFCHGTLKNQTIALACPAIRAKFFLSVKALTLLDQFLNDAA